jgi:ketosteroid isomerase-like protein
MSRENVETVQRVHRAWKADDLEAFLAELHSDAEWHPSIEPALEGRATAYHGHEGARQAWTEYRGEAFGRLAVEIDEVRDLGDTVLLLGRFMVTGRTTLIEFGSELGQVFTFRDGKIASSHDYLSHREALEAVGLRE